MTWHGFQDVVDFVIELVLRKKRTGVYENFKGPHISLPPFCNIFDTFDYIRRYTMDVMQNILNYHSVHNMKMCSIIKML
jgi:hypothetical protein